MVIEAVSELIATPVAACDRAGLARVLGLVRQVEGWLAAVTAEATRRGAALHAEGVAGDVTQALQREGGKSKRDARDAVARADMLAGASPFERALAAGEVAPAHVDVFGRAATQYPVLRDHVDDLVVAASRTTPDEFRRHCERVGALHEDDDTANERFERQRRATTAKRWIDPATGMYRLSASFDPETGEKVWVALNRQVEAQFHDTHPDTAPADPFARQDHLLALALAHLVTCGGPGSPGQVQVAVLIDHDTMVDGLHEHSVVELGTGGTLPVAEVRRLACEAGLLPIVLSGESVVLDMGRSKRLATAEQRRALRAMYPTCGVPGCPVPYHQTTIHHIDYWARDGGTTDLGTQVPVCGVHHRDEHAGRITIELDPVTRAVVVRARDGTILAQADGPPRRRRRPTP